MVISAPRRASASGLATLAKMAAKYLKSFPEAAFYGSGSAACSGWHGCWTYVPAIRTTGNAYSSDPQTVLSVLSLSITGACSVVQEVTQKKR
jgi:hypothetical protein